MSVQAETFVSAMGMDLFAPAIGIIHGFHQREPILQWELARDLSVSCHVPFVLHGATGLKDQALNELIDIGLPKVNFAAGVRVAFLTGRRDCLAEASDPTKMQVYLKCGRKSVGSLVSHILDLMML